MRNKIINLSVVVLLTSCTTYDDTTQNEDSEVAAAIESTDSGETSTIDTKTVERSEYSETPQDILERAVRKWNSLDTIAKKNKNYQSLIDLEQEGDVAYAEKNYGRAWHMYGLATSYYPSPKLAVKAGDALIFSAINNSQTICDCDTNNLPEDIRATSDSLDYLRYSIQRDYGLALDFNRYPKTGYRDEQSLTHEQETKLIEKLQCLDEKLNFEGETENTSVLAECIEVQALPKVNKG